MKLLPPPLFRACCAGLLALLLGACAQVPSVPPVEPLLHDALFAPSKEDVDPARVFALSEAMRQYADTQLPTANSPNADPRRALLRALRERGQLRLAYDASRTGNAEETFRARTGNCLSLVIMTAAFARHAGLPVTFRSVHTDPQYTRLVNLTLENGHVNLLMSHAGALPAWGAFDLLVDFLPPDELRGQHASVLEERTVIAMYMNNRAAETLTEGRLDDSYAWARASLLQDPTYVAAANTLAVVYMRKAQLQAAEAALRHALAREPQNTAALSNLVIVLRQTGRQAEAETTAALLKSLQPYPPFHFLELGRQALQDGNPALARDHFARELRRQPFQHEVHFWAAQAWLRLGDSAKAAEHLRQAMDYSTTIANQQLYSAKLDRLRALHVQ